MMNWKNWLKPLVFCAGVVAILAMMTCFFKVTDTRIYQTVRGFYEEADDSLDAVYIGASNVYAYWQAPIAWGEYGQTVYPMSVPNMPASATKYMIEECRKTQPNALYIINLNNLKDTDFTVVHMHNTLDYLPFSKTKVRMINDLCSQIGIEGMEKLEYYFPFIRFHSGWNDLTKESFDKPLSGLKGASNYRLFLKKSTDFSTLYRQTQQCVVLSDAQRFVLDDLLSYCETEQVKVLFVAVPQVIEDESIIAQMNQMCHTVQERGFNVLNLQGDTASIGLDMAADFYNEKHTNVHGSLKFTRYLSEYLRDVYGFTDKRGNPAYASWDSAYDKYLNIIQWSTLEFERNAQKRDYRLSMPQNVICSPYGRENTLVWDPVDGAQGYQIFRRNNRSDWMFIATVDEDVTAYTDQDLETYATYTYTVVPVSFDGEAVQYGNFHVLGYKVTIPIDPPELIALQESDNGITISWNPTNQADGYYVDRKIVGQSWIRLADVGNACTYTDLYVQDDLPYLYTVVPYQVSDGIITEGPSDREGLLRMADLKAPVVSVRADAEKCELSWSAVKGASDYFVYRQSEDGGWETVAQVTAGTKLFYCEVCTAEIDRVFRVSAVLKYGEEIYEYPSQSVIVSGGNA